MSTGEIPDLLTGALILIVDDEPANLQLLADLLKQRGHAVRVAPSGQLALNYISRQKPDLILLDVNMPGMNGIEALKRIKADPRWSKIPVMMVTSESERAHVIEAIQSGASSYLAKPFAPEDLIKKIMQNVGPM